MTQQHSKTHHPLYLFLGTLLLLIFVCGLYWQGLFGPYLLDDLQSIGPLQAPGLSFAEMLSTSFQNESGPLGRPVSMLSFALNQFFFGSAPLSYKATNLGLHLCMGIMVAFFVYLVLTLTRTKQPQKAIIVGFTTVLWLTHPLQVSTVLYTVQRMTILCHLYLLLAINCYLYARLRQWQHKISWPFYGLCILNGGLAIMAKETALLLPFYLFILEYTVLNFRTNQRHQNRLLALSYFCLAGVCVLGAVLYFYIQYPHFSKIYSDKPFTLLQRLYTESHALIFYIQQIIFPKISAMGLYHDDFPITQRFDSFVLIHGAVIVFSILLACLYRKRYPILALACLVGLL